MLGIAVVHNFSGKQILKRIDFGNGLTSQIKNIQVKPHMHEHEASWNSIGSKPLLILFDFVNLCLCVNIGEVHDHIREAQHVCQVYRPQAVLRKHIRIESDAN